jgi:hypothetical protein
MSVPQALVTYTSGTGTHEEVHLVGSHCMFGVKTVILM